MKKLILLVAVLGMSMSAMAAPTYPGSNCHVAPAALATPNVPEDLVFLQQGTLIVRLDRIPTEHYDIICPLPYLSEQTTISANLYLQVQGRADLRCSLHTTDKYGVPNRWSSDDIYSFDTTVQNFIVSFGRYPVKSYGTAFASCTVGGGGNTGTVIVKSYREK